MAINIIDLLKDQLTGKLSEKLGGQIGESREVTSKGLEALIPTVLGGLLKQVSQPGGADKLNETLDRDDYDGGMLDNITDMLGSGQAGKISDIGAGLTSMIFGDKIGGIIDIVSRVTGLGGKSTSSLLGLLLPLILNFLGKQKRSMGLDAGGVHRLLMDQKDHVAEALPPGMGDELGLGGARYLLANIDSGSPRPDDYQPKRRQSVEGTDAAGDPWSAWLARIQNVGAGDAAVNARPPAVAPNDFVVDIGVPEVDVAGANTPASRLNSTFGNLQTALSAINDAESAKAKLPDLESANDTLGAISESFASAPQGVQTALKEIVGNMMPQLKELINKVLAIPGAGDIVKPVLDSVLEKLAVLA